MALCHACTFSNLDLFIGSNFIDACLAFYQPKAQRHTLCQNGCGNPAFIRSREDNRYF